MLSRYTVFGRKPKLSSKTLFLFICLVFHYVKEVSSGPTKIGDYVLDGFIYIKFSEAQKLRSFGFNAQLETREQTWPHEC